MIYKEYCFPEFLKVLKCVKECHGDLGNLTWSLGILVCLSLCALVSKREDETEISKVAALPSARVRLLVGNSGLTRHPPSWSLSPGLCFGITTLPAALHLPQNFGQCILRICLCSSFLSPKISSQWGLLRASALLSVKEGAYLILRSLET